MPRKKETITDKGVKREVTSARMLEAVSSDHPEGCVSEERPIGRFNRWLKLAFGLFIPDVGNPHQRDEWHTCGSIFGSHDSLVLDHKPWLQNAQMLSTKRAFFSD